MPSKTIIILAALSAAVLAQQSSHASIGVTPSRLFGLTARQSEDDCAGICGTFCMPADASCCSPDSGAFCTAGNVCNSDSTCCPAGDTCTGPPEGCDIEGWVLCGEGMSSFFSHSLHRQPF